MLNPEALARIGTQTGVPVSRVEATISLLESGATIPFIARYRKEATGSLDEARLREIDELRGVYRALEDRRQSIIASIEKQGKLTEELKATILGSLVKTELDDLYLPFRSRRKSRSRAAIERGLGPLADYIWEQTGEEPVEVYAQRFVTVSPESVDPAAPPPAETQEVSGGNDESHESHGAVILAAYDILTGAEVAPADPDPAVVAMSVTDATVPTLPVSESADSASVVGGESSPITAPAEEAAAPADTTPAEEAAAPADTAPAEEAAAPADTTPAEEAAAPADTTTAEEAAAPADTIAAEPQSSADTPSVATTAATAEPESGPLPAPAPVQKAKGPLDRSVRSAEEAVNGALDILAERIGENADFRRRYRERLWAEGVVRARALPGKESEKTKYEMYYKFEEPVARIPSHRMLAIRRGSREMVLSYAVEIDRDAFMAGLNAEIVKTPGSTFATYLELAVRDAYDRLIAPSIQNEVRSALRERAEAEAIRVFEENLRALLMAPPAGPIAMIGIEPGLKNGCKVAVVDSAGKLVEHQVIRPAEPEPDVEGAEKTLLDLMSKHGVRGVVIGNGAGSREAEAFARATLQKSGQDVFVVMVNEAGASVYASSRRAREEFPNLDSAVRGAVSIARRLQDPLAELVKLEPRSIGVGQYQHDVDQKQLKRSLATTMESAVNRVGVDLNTASVDLLKYVSGLNEKIAAEIVARRETSGPLRSREELRAIESISDKTFEQAAGFVRITDGDQPLDRTTIHPESYALVERMAQSINVPVSDLIGNPTNIRSVDFRALEDGVGRATLLDIREELLRPGRDPRDRFVAPKYRDDVKEIGDLKDGMELEGTVTNVTNFGAFVDIGVHQDGLIHIS
ncbi:MAG TPA: Tex-like N-terminal domain-containing protein, partial [Terriglobia bacterium]|nr:Tex-like N-terminal domain-containing protein [Terriglobia bacterium]